MSKGFYDITTKIKNFLESNEDVSVVTMKALEEVDMNKRTIFPVANIIVQDTTFTSSVMRFNIQVALIDLVDITPKNPKDEDDVFLGSDNLQDVMNTQLSVANDLYSSLQRGSLNEQFYKLVGDVDCTPFQDRFENLLAGWVMNLVIDIKNEQTICD